MELISISTVSVSALGSAGGFMYCWTTAMMIAVTTRAAPMMM